jgi:hypothetical protein
VLTEVLKANTLTDAHRTAHIEVEHGIRAMRVRRGISVIVIAAMTCAPAALAAGVEVSAIPCISSTQNPRVVASVPPNIRSLRVFFRAEGPGSDYFVYMRSDERGRWWAFLPMPEATTRSVVYRIGGADEKGIPVSSPVLTTSVVPTCPSQVMTADEQRFAQNLIVGLTIAAQSPIPAGFQCRGIVSYIAANGELKPNDECRRKLAAAATSGATAAPTGTTAAAGAATSGTTGLSNATLGALAAVGLGAIGFASYEHNKSTAPTSPSRP